MNSNKVGKQHKMKCNKGTFHIINLNQWSIVEDRAMKDSIIKVQTSSKMFGRHYEKRVKGLTAWALPYINLKDVSFPNKLDALDVNGVDSFQQQLLKYTIERIERKLMFRIQDGISKVVDGRQQNFVADMSFVQFQLFLKYLVLNCMGDYSTEGDYVKDHGDITSFLIHSVEFKTVPGRTMPPLSTSDWSTPKWIDKQTGECKRGFVSQLKFVYSEYTGLVRADMIYWTQRYCDKSNSWIFC